jgi:hypothetical protein
LTKEQAYEALHHGWVQHGDGPFCTDTKPELYAVKRGVHYL